MKGRKIKNAIFYVRLIFIYIISIIVIITAGFVYNNIFNRKLNPGRFSRP